MNDPRVEALAAVEHEQWMHWAQAILVRHNIPRAVAARWRSLFVAYQDLPEEHKETDRTWARQALSIMAEQGLGFRFQLGQEVRIRDAKIEARVLSRIEEEAQLLYRIVFWNQGQRQMEVLPESELEPC